MAERARRAEVRPTAAHAGGVAATRLVLWGNKKKKGEKSSPTAGDDSAIQQAGGEADGAARGRRGGDVDGGHAPRGAVEAGARRAGEGALGAQWALGLRRWAKIATEHKCMHYTHSTQRMRHAQSIVDMHIT